MYIRLPRLIAAVRQAGNSIARTEKSRMEALSTCLVLLTQLEDTSDSRSESTLLESAITGEAADTVHQSFLTSPFQFSSRDEMCGLVEYWEARLFVVSLARTIVNIPDLKDPRSTDLTSARTDLDAIAHEQLRLVRNVLQSFTAFEKSSYANISITSTLIAAWGALSTMDSFDDRPIDEVKTLLFSKCVEALDPRREGFSREDLDRVSWMLVGGSTDFPFEANLLPQTLRSMFFAGGVVSGEVKDLR